MILRLKGWENRLNEVIEKHRILPSEYGISDCYMLADDAVLALTGQRIFDDVQYDSKLGAAKELLRHGFENVEDAFADKFERIPPSLAQRGDIGIVISRNEICGGFFSSIGFVVRDDYQLTFLSVSNVHSAFKVGR